MENKYDILTLLRGVADGTTSPEDALLKLKEAPFEDLGYAKVDFHRSVRQGAAEVIYGAGKTPEQIAGIARTMGKRGCRNILVTRISQETADLVGQSVPLDYHPEARLGLAYPGEQKRLGNIVVATGGTSDMPVAEEAALTAEAMGNQVTRLYDVGGRAPPAALQPGHPHVRPVRGGCGGDGGGSGLRGGRPGGLPGHRGAHQRGLRGQLRRPVRPVEHAELLRLRVQRSEYRQRLRRGVPGQPD